MKGRGAIGKRSRGLNLEPLEFIFTMAQEIKVSLDDPSFLGTHKEWSSYSWGMLGHLLIYGVGQWRIGKKLGLSRQGVNNAFNKKAPLEFKIENTFLPVTKELEGHVRYSPNERDQRLKQIDSNAFRMLPNGQIVRQWVNRYSISKEWLSNFKLGAKTFKYSNRALSKHLYSDNNQTENLDFSMLAVKVKEHSWKKAEKRQEQIFKRHDRLKSFKKEQGIRGRKNGVLNYREINRAIYTDNNGTAIRQLPKVIENEVREIYRAGFELPYQIYGEQSEGFIEKVELKVNLRSISVNNESSLINEFLLKEELIRTGFKNGDETITRQMFNLSMMSNRLYQEQRSKQ